MEHHFNLPVVYKEEELQLRVRLVTFGYTYKYYVSLGKDEIIIERDEEMNFRVLAPSPDVARSFDKELCAIIITALERLSD